jgi:hypothetical protein
MLKHAHSAAGADDPAAEVKFSDWNADHVIDSDGVTIATSTATPATPSSGAMVIFGRTVAGGALPAYVGPSGMSSALQPFMGRNKIGMLIPTGNSTSVTNIGMAPLTVNGTAVARNVTTTNMLTAARRVGRTSSSSSGQFTGDRASAFQLFRSNTAGMGGFRFVARWGCSDAATVAGARTFVGLAAASVGTINPSSATNIIGVGTDDTDANLQIIYNDGTGVASKIDLGANFPDHTLSADLYEVAIYCAPNSTSIGVEVTRLNTGASTTATLTTDIPAVNTLLGPQIMRNNGATALAVGIDVVSLYVETDN